MSRVLATSSERFHHNYKDSNTKVVYCLSRVSRRNVTCQLATSSENLVASTQFLVALATSKSQFQALDVFSDCDLNFLCSVHSFTVIRLLLSELTQREVSREDLVVK